MPERMPEPRAQNLTSEGLRQVLPSTCRPWRFHNRSSAWLDTQAQTSLEQSIQKDGQQQPGLVRILEDDPDFQYEVVFGYRRCSACLNIGQLFLAKVLPAATSDQACARLMHLENEERANVSELERARNYAALIAGGVFAEQSELAAQLEVSKSRVSQMLKAAEVFDYPWLASLIEPGLIGVSVRNATQLARALSNPTRQRLMRDRAHRITQDGGRLEVTEIIRQLLAEVGPTKHAVAKREVLARVGRSPVAQISRTKGGGVHVSVEHVDRSPEETDALIGEIAKKMRAYLIRDHAAADS